MIPIAITKDIEKFLKMIENIYDDILQDMYEDIKTEILKNT